MRTPSSAPAAGGAPLVPRRVILLHPGALGDVIQALPAFSAIRAGWPDARLTLVTDAALAPVVAPLGVVDAIIGFDAGVAYHGRATSRGALFARLVRAMRAARPDVVAVFKGATAYAALAAACGARVRAGLTRGPAGRLLTHPVTIDAERHREDRYADVVRALGLGPDRRATLRWPSPPPPLPEGPDAPRRWLVVAPGGARNAKEEMASRRWPAERFAQAAAALLRDDPTLGAAVLGGRGDRAEAEHLAAALPPGRTVNLAGNVDLFAARAVIAAGSVYLGNDSGLMHLAATTSTPAVIVFGPTDPRVAAPRTPGMHALWSPVGERACVDDATGRHRPCARTCCIARVGVPEVTAALARVLAGAHPPAAAAAGR